MDTILQLFPVTFPLLMTTCLLIARPPRTRVHHFWTYLCGTDVAESGRTTQDRSTHSQYKLPFNNTPSSLEVPTSSSEPQEGVPL